MAQQRTTNKLDLSEDDIEFIMANTDFKREKVIEWYTGFKKQCPSGKLDKNQFIKFYKQLIPGEHPDEDQFCLAVFEVFDSDGNGYVDFAEFLIAFWIRTKGSVKEKLSWIFDIYDSDRSGYVTRYELYKMLKLVFNIKSIKEDPMKRSEEIMKQLDRSKDGKLSRQEFIAGCSRDPTLRSLFAPF